MDVAQLIGGCREIVRAGEPPDAVADLLADLMRHPTALRELGPTDRTTYRALHRDPEFTILHIVFPPGAESGAHDHRMWVATGIFHGREHNQLFASTDDGHLQATSEYELSVGEVRVLPSDAIHSIRAAPDAYLAAIHVYGGDLFAATRSAWGPDGTERPFDEAAVQRLINAVNSREDELGRSLTHEDVSELLTRAAATSPS